ncbi:bifunctional DNA-formamidopyrimidine glycosylase/DNA-(apurinic or apyrimidinic site) lyase [Pseudonocardia humida]|uniref:Formamidopyrimidine-DNA glycosylase n=1 Tax=Pseudonocardia humida TaxID=2800819 RepID=A0ABT0ZUD5_9PSEU|nr:bifunctional DNA-formamidopyrimidine glycosylase/DNA-(apurinic or apyrimidinic site) lyase [Pseudonocardia humida]MCO1654346.1 bifunctional DNA-formamidopyrimidine glycosylase/DNA-(apurinic or apyrimidinic site) lyase [Pseudonocardia humida]
MPELPEVEVVRLGLADHVLDRKIAEVEVAHPRAVRRHAEGGLDFAARLAGRTITGARRRGKYLWLDLDGGAAGDDAVLAHLGMSGQMLVADATRPDEKHLRIRFRFADDGSELRFVDQRTFGGLSVHPLVPATGGGLLPGPVAHIARDPMDPLFDLDAAVAAVRRRRTELKRALLDQTVVSGIGNIYADEALWRAKLHSLRPTEALTRAQGRAVLEAATEVMAEALRAGGTSFDALYVNVNGASGYFDRRLDAYGQADRPCRRCGTPIRRDAFMNRSSFSCPRCQPRPRHRATGGITASRGA